MKFMRLGKRRQAPESTGATDACAKLLSLLEALFHRKIIMLMMQRKEAIRWRLIAYTANQ